MKRFLVQQCGEIAKNRHFSQNEGRKFFREKKCLQISDVKLLSNDTADRFVGMAQRSRKIFGSKVGKNFLEKNVPTNL